MDSIALIELLKIKNEKAISYLYDTYSSPLYGVILRTVKSHQQAEVILENTFFAILDKVDTYKDHTRNLFAWMVCIARTTTQQAGRLSDADSSAIDLNEFESVESCCPELIEGMEIRCKNVLMHIYFRNYTILETSLLLDIPLQEVKVLWKSALHHIHNRISVTQLSSLTGLIFSALICHP